MDPALISVVIPCYNQGHYLAEAIGSVREGGVSPVEIVVVDDGSTDETPRIAASFDGVALISQPNAGLARARNSGLEACRAPFVVFLDADDRLAPGGLDTGLRAIASHPACAFVYGRCLMMSADGAILPTPSQPRIDGGHYLELLRRNYIWMPAMAMFRREAVEGAGGFSTSAHASADYDLYLRLARTHAIHDHGEVVAWYRRHTDNMSSNAGRMLRETLAVLGRQRPFVMADPALAAAYEEGLHNWRDFYGTHLVNEIRAHVRARQWGPALRKAATLGRLHPGGLRHHAFRKLRATVRSRT